MLQVIACPVGLLQNLSYLVYCPKTREAALIDPAFEAETLAAVLQDAKLTLRSILITHTHHDHIEAIPRFCTDNNLTIYVHKAEQALLPVYNAQLVGIQEGTRLKLGQEEIYTLHTPGHSPGSVCFDLGDAVITGDLLFVGSCGSPNFPGGDSVQLWQSLQKLLRELPPEHQVLPGHSYGGDRSTLYDERHQNVFLRSASLEEFQRLCRAKS